MPNIVFNIPLYFTGITTCIYTELPAKLMATAVGKALSGDPDGAG